MRSSEAFRRHCQRILHARPSAAIFSTGERAGAETRARSRIRGIEGQLILNEALFWNTGPPARVSPQSWPVSSKFGRAPFPGCDQALNSVRSGTAPPIGSVGLSGTWFSRGPHFSMRRRFTPIGDPFGRHAGVLCAAAAQNAPSMRIFRRARTHIGGARFVQEYRGGSPSTRLIKKGYRAGLLGCSFPVNVVSDARPSPAAEETDPPPTSVV